MVQATSAYANRGNVGQLQQEVARDVAVLKKQKEVTELQGQQAVKLIQASGVGQLLDIRV